ncbi:MAG: LysM peptidoglycan-binding domain-containing protein [Lachnospiraceae bacterium]|nr:LysM peptidoglycan-binding domain-containing protein [Lachnospiraceae bacterium]
MDKQTNILTNTQNVIPVNTRTIGAPEGIYILYLEDYVHTFIKKILSDNSQNVLLSGKHSKEQQEYQIERISSQEIALYGRSVEENGRYRIVISGAAVSDGGSERIQQLNTTYFPSCTYIGNASVSLNKDSRLRLELILRSTKVVLDDFYIYYDQNEEMQNYLVEWNTTRENDRGKIILSPTEQGAHTRSSATDAAHLSRITQAYNREEAKVSFMWNVMNVLCLGFVVCVMAYGIISMNNYNKMQNMQASIDYCMAFIEENTSFLMNAASTNTEQSQPVSAMQQSMQAENNTVKPSEPQIDEPDAAQMESYTAMETEQSAQERSEMQALAQPVIQDLAQSEETPETTQALAQTVDEPESLQSVTEQNAPSMQEQASTPQYYIVRRGDTLRTICYAIYGDYSRVDEICRWNNIDDPDNILYGQKLLLP